MDKDGTISISILNIRIGGDNNETFRNGRIRNRKIDIKKD